MASLAHSSKQQHKEVKEHKGKEEEKKKMKKKKKEEEEKEEEEEEEEQEEEKEGNVWLIAGDRVAPAHLSLDAFSSSFLPPPSSLLPPSFLPPSPFTHRLSALFPSKEG